MTDRRNWFTQIQPKSNWFADVPEWALHMYTTHPPTTSDSCATILEEEMSTLCSDASFYTIHHAEFDRQIEGASNVLLQQTFTLILENGYLREERGSSYQMYYPAYHAVVTGYCEKDDKSTWWDAAILTKLHETLCRERT